jgi:hypothetical protein
MANQTDFLSSIDEKFQIKVFGKKVSDIDITAKKQTVLSKGGVTKLILVKVFGTKLFGDCIKLPSPFYTLLPDNGMPSDGCGDLGNPDEYLMWVLGKNDEFVSLLIETGTVEEIIKKGEAVRLNVDADFHIHDVTVSGTTVSAKLRAYLHLRQPGPFGTTIFDITVINGDYSFSVNIDTCITVFSIAVASAQVCFHTNPNRVCGEVSVGIDLPVIGHWGQNFPIACVNI